MSKVGHRLTAMALAGAAAAATLAATTPSAQAARTPTCGGVRATIVGTPGDDRLRGTPQQDVVVARGGDDVVRGLRGNDLICGGPGRDRLLGQGGSDRLFGQGGADTLKGGTDAETAGEGFNMRGDTLDGGPGSDVLVGGRDPRHRRFADVLQVMVPDRISFRSARHGVRVDLTRGRRADGVARGAGRDTIRWQPVLGVVGSRHDDHIDGGWMAPRVDALAGDDWVSTYLRGPVRQGPWNGYAYVFGRGGTDTYAPRHRGDGGVYEIDARYGGIDFHNPGYADGPDNGLAMGFERWDLAGYRVGRVRFVGSKHADTVIAGPSPVVATMRGGDDLVRLGAGRDSVDGGAGSDTVTGARGGDSCTAVERGDCG